MPDGFLSIVALIMVLIFIGIVTSAYFLIKPEGLRDCPFECCVNMEGWKEKLCPTGLECVGNRCVKLMEYGIDFKKVNIFSLSFWQSRYAKPCEDNAAFFTAPFSNLFVWDQMDSSWKLVDQFPPTPGKVELPKHMGKEGVPCVIFPADLWKEINYSYCRTPRYLAYARYFPENISCDYILRTFFCSDYYFFDKIVPVDIVLNRYYTKEEMEDSWGPDLNSTEIACGFFDTNNFYAVTKFLKENAEICPEQLKSYLDEKISYIALNLLGKDKGSAGVPCVPKVKLTPSKDVNILVIFAYSDQPIPADVITTLKGSTKDKSLNYISDWYRSEALRLTDKPVNIDFIFLDKQYEVDIDPTYVKENYEIRDEVVAEEKFLYEELIQPLKKHDVNLEDYDAALILYNNPELFSNKIWVSGGHADRHRGFAYVNLAVWLLNGKLDMGDAEGIVHTAAHELGHVFGAYDIGTIEGKNCLMGSGNILLSENELCTYKDVGWYDVDGDGIIEVDDPCPYDKENFCKQ